MNKYSTDVRVFIVLQMARCDENVKAVQRAWQEKFHNKNWPNKRTMARRAAEMLGIKRTSLQRIMKELELSPYKIQVTQPLNEDHTQR
ncbi:hypothetical protein NPIL_205141 [Nephila pilipes]|uniref:DUF4817 domain-containing protein n=1 Tax=Nephila pilipes TaxID=299642 RepID=A0A8X6I3M5_NEPPI|nr:hypothetical protein NPIL_205141 [Nephila pilipes]